MEIEYTLRPEDFRAFTRYYRKVLSGPITFSPLAALGVAVITLAWGLALLLAAFFFEVEGLAVGMLSGALWAVLLLGYLQTCNNRAIHKAQCEDPRSEWAVRDVRLVISPAQLRTVARGATSMYEWSRVWHIGVTEKHIFLCITGNTAIVIPRPAFCDTSHCEEFVALAHQYRQDWREQNQKPTGIITSLPPESTAITRPDVP